MAATIDNDPDGDQTDQWSANIEMSPQVEHSKAKEELKTEALKTEAGVLPNEYFTHNIPDKFL